jgi:hypothetical protein
MRISIPTKIRAPLSRAYRVLYLLYDRFVNGVKHEAIDPAIFKSKFSLQFREAVADRATHCLRKGDNVGFFAHTGTYVNRHTALPTEIERLNDLFPPNIAALDFLTKNCCDPKKELILDYACGIGVMLVYLRNLGFVAYGFDNWSQVAQITSEEFLSANGIAGCLLSEHELASHPFTILNCVGIPWDWLTNLSAVLEQPSLKYLLIDRHYRPQKISGFKRAVEYKDLLTVYSRDS